jgi:hypothetical protein
MRTSLLLLLLASCAVSSDEDVALDDGKSDASAQVVYLNFGGDRLTGGNCSDAPTNCSSLVAGTQDFAPFAVSDEWDRAKVVAAITSCVGMFFDDMNVRFVTTRPASGAYSMMMIGAIYPTQLGFPQNGQGPFGRAPVDCGNDNQRDIGFLLLEDDVNPDFYFVCRSIAHELGHMFGMVHTRGPNAVHDTRVDMMCETAECFDPVIAGSANWDTVNRAMTSEVEACDGSSTQNTYARLMDNLGVRR